MMTVLKVNSREGGGPKGRVRKIRLDGGVPGIVYGGTEVPVAISLDQKLLMKEMRRPGFFNHLFELDFGKKKARVLARDVQFHPVTDEPLHIDFMRTSQDSRVTVSVPLKFINSEKSPGLKRGAIMNIIVHALELSTLANAIPEHLVVDLEGLQIGDVVHLEKLNLSKDLRVLHPERDNTLLTIVAPSGMTDETTNDSET